ncbi:hypothetical protein [Paraflavitalea speifideaquila]
MLAYTNRFLALASLIRNLHDKYKKTLIRNISFNKYAISGQGSG